MDESVSRLPWQESLKKGVFFLVCGLFFCLGLNHFVYPPLYTAAFGSLILLLNWSRRRSPASSLLSLPLPLLLFLYIGLTPGKWFKDAPIATMMAASFVVGLGGGLFYRERLVWFYGILSFCLSICFLYGLINGFPGSMMWESKLKLFYYHNGVMALVCVWCILYLLLNRQNIPSQWKGAFYGSLLLNLLILALSGSRSAYIGCAFSALAIGLLYYRKHIGKVLLCGFAFFACVYLVLPGPEQDRALSLLCNPLQDKTFQSRLPIWEVALAGIKDAPFTGRAQRNFYAYDKEYKAQHLNEMKRRYAIIEDSAGHPHSLYLGILFMSGIIGLLLWLAIYLPAVRWALEQNDRFFLSFLFFFLAYGLSDFSLHRKDGAITLFFPLGVVYGRHVLDTLLGHKEE